jgi:hypothetical protein
MSRYSLDTVTSLQGGREGKILWWYCRACSPLPIPNREVKPLMADGTAQQCGRVGSCHILLKRPFESRGVFVFVHLPIPKRPAFAGALAGERS